MPKLVQYTLLESGIHKFTWVDNSPGAAREYADLFMPIHDKLPENALVHFLLDFRQSGTPSFASVTASLKNFKQREDITIRLAHLYSDTLFPLMMKNITTYNQLNTIRKYFKEDEEQQAIDWLLSDE